MPTDPFSTVAATYDEWYATPLGAFIVEEEEALLAAAIGPAAAWQGSSPGAMSRRPRLLEIGAGTGWWSRRFAERGFDVTALEPSAAMREASSTGAGLPAITWVSGRGEALPFEAGTFEVVLLMTVVEFVADPALVLAEAWRVLRAPGALIVGLLDPLSPWAALYRRLGDQGIAPWASARFVTADDLAQMLGRPPDALASGMWLAPGARQPFADANRSGQAAGNAGALTVLRWRKER